MSNSLQVVCPHCHTTNRLPEEGLAQHPNCGKCKLPLFSAQPVELDPANFDRHISRSDLPVVVDFWAPWCGPCKTMAPAFAQAAGLLEPQYRLAKVNTETAQALAAHFNIRSIPTLLVFHKGREIARQSGAMDAASLVRWIRKQH